MKMYKNIPYAIRIKKQWVNCWENSKVPMQTFAKKAASSTNPETWGTFENAVSNVEGGTYDDIGYVFNNDGLVGIDVDCGFTDGLLSPLCADIMQTCRSYTEKSRSGRGVHILLRGKLPFPGKNNLNGVEIYQARRFFIMTGRVLIFPEIVENQAAIDYVVEKYFPEVEKEGKKSPLVQRIYTPMYRKPLDGTIFLRPEYPPILSGGRNLSLTSLAGAMHNTGYTKAQIYTELCYVNQTQCKPPLPVRELETICESVTRYRR